MYAATEVFRKVEAKREVTIVEVQSTMTSNYIDVAVYSLCYIGSCHG